MEEGEATAEAQLDVEKIIEFPGFTVETSKEIVDVSTMYIQFNPPIYLMVRVSD